VTVIVWSAALTVGADGETPVIASGAAVVPPPVGSVIVGADGELARPQQTAANTDEETRNTRNPRMGELLFS